MVNSVCRSCAGAAVSGGHAKWALKTVYIYYLARGSYRTLTGSSVHSEKVTNTVTS